MRRLVLAAAHFAASAAVSSAIIIPFDLQGNAGFGLLSGNENISVSGTPGSGGEIGAGISFADVTSVLADIDFGWGSGNGFADLTGNASAGHIPGITTSPAPASFTQNAGS